VWATLDELAPARVMERVDFIDLHDSSYASGEARVTWLRYVQDGLDGFAREAQFATRDDDFGHRCDPFHQSRISRRLYHFDFHGYAVAG